MPVFGIFNVGTDVDARDCTQGLYGHRQRVCTGSGLWEENPLLQWGLKAMSTLHLAFQSDALPAELFLALMNFFFLSFLRILSEILRI